MNQVRSFRFPYLGNFGILLTAASVWQPAKLEMRARHLTIGGAARGRTLRAISSSCRQQRPRNPRGGPQDPDTKQHRNRQRFADRRHVLDEQAQNGGACCRSDNDESGNHRGCERTVFTPRGMPEIHRFICKRFSRNRAAPWRLGRSGQIDRSRSAELVRDEGCQYHRRDDATSQTPAAESPARYSLAARHLVLRCLTSWAVTRTGAGKRATQRPLRGGSLLRRIRVTIVAGSADVVGIQ